MKKTLQNILPIAEAIQRLLHPYAEVVVHDMEKNKIVALYHPFSKRRPGDSSFLSTEEMNSLGECTGPYEKLNWDGRKLRSVSSIIRDENAQTVGLLCINLDISALDKFQRILSDFMKGIELVSQPIPFFKDDWQERLNQYIHHYLAENYLSLTNLKRGEKKKLIEHLHGIGAFTGKNSAHYVAQVLGISRASVYNYMQKPLGRIKDD